MKMTRTACIAMLSIQSALVVADPGVEDMAALAARASAKAETIGKQALPVDPRIKLARCPQAPTIEANEASSLAVRCSALGWRLRVAMVGQAGQQLAGQVRAAPLIRRGDLVRVRIISADFAISYSAVAIDSGGLGDLVTLRADGTKAILSATVTGPGQASLLD